MSSCFATWTKLPKRLPLRQWLTTKAPAGTVVRQIATESASGKTAAAGGEAEVADPFSTAAVRTRREIWGVRNISKLLVTLALRFSN